VFWKVIRGLRGKRSHAARSIKNQNGLLCNNDKDILDRWREYFEDPITFTTSDKEEVHLGEENTITAAEVSLAVKTLQAAMKSDLKCSKA